MKINSKWRCVRDSSIEMRRVPSRNTIELRNDSGADLLLYEIDLDRCKTSAQALDWIAQVSAKGWATDALVGMLVRAMDEALQFQKNLCPMGVEKALWPKADHGSI